MRLFDVQIAFGGPHSIRPFPLSLVCVPTQAGVVGKPWFGAALDTGLLVRGSARVLNRRGFVRRLLRQYGQEFHSALTFNPCPRLARNILAVRNPGAARPTQRTMYRKRFLAPRDNAYKPLMA